jgi:hypothetical protein
MALDFHVRFEAVAGVADTPWLTLSPGISVMTGRNNVGKTRMMRLIDDMRRAAGDPDNFANVPQLRISDGSNVVEVDFRRAVGLPEAYRVSPRSYSVTKNGAPFYVGEWRHDQAFPVLGSNAPPTRGSAQVTNGTVFSNNPALPERERIHLALGYLIYVPAQRRVPAVVGTNPVQVPSPDGSDFGQVIYYHLNKRTSQGEQLQHVISEMFHEVERILTDPTGANQVTLKLHDRYTGQDMSLDDTGTGVAQMLHLVGSVLFNPPGRVFLIDEPTTYLHPGAEKMLATFLRDHPEHAYVLTTHSPILISAAQPDRAWLVNRDERGTVVRRAFGEGAGRQHVFAELGVSSGDVALAERVLFVEGPSDAEIYGIILDKLGFDLIAAGCTVVPLGGFGAAAPVEETFDRLAALLNLRFLVYLDGDRKGTLANTTVRFLPEKDIERVLIRDAGAVFRGFAAVLKDERPDLLEGWQDEWDEAEVDTYILARLDKEPDVKGSKVLGDLAQEMTLVYKKSVHGPSIARELPAGTIADLKPDFAGLFDESLATDPTTSEI